MIYWLIILIVVFVLGWIYTYTDSSDSIKRILFLVIVISLSYFSAFRDELGKDYSTYVHSLLFSTNFGFSLSNMSVSEYVLSEPVFNSFAILIRNTKFSPVLFFLTMSVLTVSFTLLAYRRYDYFFVILFVYMLVPVLYSLTFNIVRQACAASIFLFSVIYIEKRNYKMYFLFILFSVLMHKSAIFLIPLYFLRETDYNRIHIIIIIGLSFLTGFIPKIESNFSSVIYALNYGSYLDYTNTNISGVSITIVLLHLFLIPVLVYKKKVLNFSNSKNYIIAIKMYVIYLVFTNIATTSFNITYRLSFYFVLFVPIVVSMVIKLFDKKKDRRFVTFMIISLFIIVGVNFFIVNANNTLLMPDKLLPFSSLLD